MGSNFEKVDSYVNGPADYEEIPELTDEDFARGMLMMNGVPLRRGPGRPAPNGAKQQITLRLEPAVLDGLRATGPGWQARINDILREWLGKQAA